MSRKLSKPQREMSEALTWLASQPDLFRPGIKCRGAQHSTARALARRGLAVYLPSGTVEPSRDTCALVSGL